MSWSKPVIREIECGMEINMYGPEQDDNEREVLKYMWRAGIRSAH